MNVILATKIEDSVIESLLDGDGVRLVLFFSGCFHHCVGCHNPSTWDMNNGVSYKLDDVVNYVSSFLKKGAYDGITLSGGDPFFQSKAAVHLIDELKQSFPSINIWVYTGFLFDQIKENPLTKKVDVIVDGPFEQTRKFPKKKFRGSNNQRLLHLKNGVIWKEE